MIFKGIRKIHEGKFITRYDVDYLTAEGNEKTYEIVSRRRNMQTLEALQNKTPDSVILILTDESGGRILLNREYRMAMAQWIYNFPAGLIDPGETPEESARRELWEETGLRLIRVDDVPAAQLEDLPAWAEIISNVPAAIDADALRQERDRLMARIQEIDQILAAL